MNTFRYAALAILAVLVLGYGVYWMSFSRTPAPPPAQAALEVSVTIDGAISIDGERFTDPGELRKIIAVVRKQTPITVIVARTPKNISAENIGKAVKLLHDSGEDNVSVEAGTGSGPAED
jgi:hypothetical protein